jgi:hypothetical protein
MHHGVEKLGPMISKGLSMGGSKYKGWTLVQSNCDFFYG